MTKGDDRQVDNKDQDIADVIASESQRGKGRALQDASLRRKQKALEAELLRALKARNERGFSAALRSAGMIEGSPEWGNAWKAYRTYWKVS